MPTPEAKQPFEIQAAEVTVEGASTPDYPLQKKRHTFEYLRTISHLRPRTNTFEAVFRVRSLCAYAVSYTHLHVLANSDAKDDQNVKLRVRDAVGHMLGQKLKKVTDRAQTEKIVQDHMDEIIETAEKMLRQNGYTYGVRARLANVDFPVRCV